MTDKVVFLFGRKDGLTADEFRRHYLDVHAPLALRSMRGLHRYVVNLAHEDEVAPYDAVTELVVDSVAGLFDPARAFVDAEAAKAVLADHASFLGTMHAYRVEERVVRDYERTWPDGERSPGVKFIAPTCRAEGMSHDEFDAHWRDRHAPLALEHHGGMSKYVQNVVVEHLTGDAPELDGVGELHFPSEAAFRDRFFTSPESAEVILDDAYRFIARDSAGYRFAEYVMR